MDETPRANRLHIGVFGRRNAGKSSLINFLTNQRVALVSETPGTTTDPVLKSMELLPLGPVVFVDTAGLDDEGELGELRISRTREMMARTDLAMLLVPADSGALDISRECEWLDELKEAKVAVFGVVSRSDLTSAESAEEIRGGLEQRMGIPFVAVSTASGEGRSELLDAIVTNAPSDFERQTIVGDLIWPGACVVLVAPQDIQAPKGRLILPQVQTIRDILDAGAMALTVTDPELVTILAALKRPPDLVVTDSQVFAHVNGVIPSSVPLTSFSILMARYKGELSTFVHGARRIATLQEHDKVLISEACTHHALDGDIGREKIPRWLREKVGSKLRVDVSTGQDFPANLKDYALIVHCGACMFTRKQLMSRLIKADAANVPITNYGIAIAALNGILDRVTGVFPELQLGRAS